MTITKSHCARKIIFLILIKLFGAIWLIKPDNLNCASLVTQGRLGKSEIPAHSARRNRFYLCFYGDFSRFQASDVLRLLKVLIVAREMIDQIAKRKNSRLMQNLGGLWANTLHLFNWRGQIHIYILLFLRGFWGVFGAPFGDFGMVAI